MKDTESNGFLKGLRLSSAGTFDTELTLQLTRRRTNEVKADKRYHYIRKTANFDSLPLQSKENYPSNLRVVRIKLSENHYKSLVANLEPVSSSSEVLKTLYHFL